MATTTNAPLPRERAIEAKMLAEHPQFGGLHSPSNHLVGYIVSVKDVEQANRFADERLAFEVMNASEIIAVVLFSTRFVPRIHEKWISHRTKIRPKCFNYSNISNVKALISGSHHA